MLAIVRALEEWRHFVEGAEHRCEIWTDHKNLQYLMTAKKLNWRQARWSLLLARFDFIMHHRPSKSMGKTDTLSCRSNHGTGSEDNDNMVLLTPNFFAVQALEGLEAAGEERGILKDIRQGTRDGEKEEPVARATRELQSSSAHSIKSAEWSLTNGLLYIQVKIYVPANSTLFPFCLLHGILSVWTSLSSCHNLQGTIPLWLSSILSQSVHISFPWSLQSLPPEPHTFSSTMCGNITVSLRKSSPIEVPNS